jgi:hypothetical protein
MMLLASMFSGCGGEANSATGRSEVELRSFLKTVRADGRAERFAHLCGDDMSRALGRLDYLLGGRCPSDLAVAWREGVQIATVGSATPITITGNTAVIHDGGTPDRAVKIYGTWMLAEVRRNRRHAFPEESCDAAREVNLTLIPHRLPAVNLDELGCNREHGA